MKPKNLELYEKVKKDVDKIYEKPSAYKSMYIIKEYKKRGGEFYDDEKPKLLKRWMEEEWKDIGNKNYPVFRPTKKISSKTPLLVSEIDKSNLQKQIKLKQKIKGDKNLPPFKKKNN